MRWYLDGEPVELAEASPSMRLADRVLVRTADGVFSGAAVRDGEDVLVSFRGATYRLSRRPPARAGAPAESDGLLLAPMPGLIVQADAEVGQTLRRGAKVAVLEAMKTQFPIAMPFDGTVEAMHVRAGDQVEQGARLAQVSPAAIEPA